MQRGLMRLLMMGIVTVTAYSRGMAESDEKVQTVLRLHQATVSQIHDISLSIDRKYRFRGHENFKQGISNTWRWSRSQDKTRILSDAHVVRPDGWPSCSDTFCDRRNKAVYNLDRWNENLPRPLKPWDNGLVSAYIDESFLPDHPFLDAGVVASTLLLTFAPPSQPDIEKNGITYYLPDQLIPLATRVEYDEIHDQSRLLVRVRLHWDHLRLTYTDLFFDPEAGYLVQKMEQLALASSDASTGGAKSPLFTIIEATEIQAFPNGVFLPVKLLSRIYAKPGDVGKTPVLETHITVTDLVVNQPLPEEAFDFQFPENAIVRYFPPQDGKVKAVIWGGDNRPRQDIRSSEDIQALARAEALAPRRRLWGVIGASVAALLAVGAFVYLRWRTA